jgi:hypothetical protein
MQVPFDRRRNFVLLRNFRNHHQLDGQSRFSRASIFGSFFDARAAYKLGTIPPRRRESSQPRYQKPPRTQILSKRKFYLVNNMGQGHLVLESVRKRVVFTLTTWRSCTQNHASITRESCHYRSFRGHLIALGCAHISRMPRQPGEST